MTVCDDRRKAASPHKRKRNTVGDAGAASDVAFPFLSLKGRAPRQSSYQRPKFSAATVTVVTSVTARFSRVLSGGAAVTTGAASGLNYPYLGFRLREAERGLWLVKGNVFVASFTGFMLLKLCRKIRTAFLGVLSRKGHVLKGKDK